MALFDPEKMAVYRLARQHTRAMHKLLKSAQTRGFADLVNQVRRCVASIPANLLESAGEWRPGKRLNYLMIAKGSAWECWAHTDTMIDFEIVTDEDIQEVRGLQREITALLITTIRRLEAEGIKPEPPDQINRQTFDFTIHNSQFTIHNLKLKLKLN